MRSSLGSRRGIELTDFSACPVICGKHRVLEKNEVTFCGSFNEKTRERGASAMQYCEGRGTTC